MTKGELKRKLDDCLINGIINIAKDSTVVSKKDQIQGLLFHWLTDDYWDVCNDNEEI